MKLGGVVKVIKDSLFPYFCEGCGTEGEWWCKKCRGKVEFKTLGAVKDLKNLTALFNYEELGPLARLIKKFKYSLVSDLAELWKQIIVEAQMTFGEDLVVVAVPLYEKRLRVRGYNQAMVIAGIVAEALGIPLSLNGLVRLRQTKQQAKLGARERQENVRDAFAWKGGTVPKRVLLVDDVYTTGATMAECAKVLKESGTDEVFGFVLACSGGRMLT